MNWFRDMWETINEGTNMQGVALILAGAWLAAHGHDNIGTGISTGGFTLLNNSKKREPAPEVKSEAVSK